MSALSDDTDVLRGIIADLSECYGADDIAVRRKRTPHEVRTVIAQLRRTGAFNRPGFFRAVEGRE